MYYCLHAARQGGGGVNCDQLYVVCNITLEWSKQTDSTTRQNPQSVATYTKMSWVIRGAMWCTVVETPPPPSSKTAQWRSGAATKYTPPLGGGGGEVKW